MDQLNQSDDDESLHKFDRFILGLPAKKPNGAVSYEINNDLSNPIDLTGESKHSWLTKEAILNAQQRGEIDLTNDNSESGDVSVLMDDDTPEPFTSTHGLNGELDHSDLDSYDDYTPEPFTTGHALKGGITHYHGKVTNFTIAKNCGGKHIYNF